MKSVQTCTSRQLESQTKKEPDKKGAKTRPVAYRHQSHTIHSYELLMQLTTGT